MSKERSCRPKFHLAYFQWFLNCLGLGSFETGRRARVIKKKRKGLYFGKFLVFFFSFFVMPAESRRARNQVCRKRAVGAEEFLRYPGLGSSKLPSSLRRFIN